MKELRFVLGGVQLDIVEVDGKAGHVRSLSNYVSAIWRRRKAPAILVVWPLLGWLDIVLYRTLCRGRVWIIVHDPMPLRRQFGMGRWSGRLAKAFLGSGVGVICLSQSAVTETSRIVGSAHVVLLPHPMLPRVAPRPSTERLREEARRNVLVLGQYKPARDLRLLHELGSRLSSSHFRATIAGTGWPEIDGWSYEAGFLTEDEFDAQLDEADVLVLPYSKYFQSGVAVRALERGCAVVGENTDFLSNLLRSSNLFNLTEESMPEDWVKAIYMARPVSENEYDVLLEIVEAAWRDWLSA